MNIPLTDYIYIYVYTYTHATHTVLIEKLTCSQLVNNFPLINGTRKFIIALISARHLSLS